jgi:hypothetical protein
MDYVYTIYSGKIDVVVEKFLASLDENVDCKVLFFGVDISLEDRDKIGGIHHNLQVIDVPTEEWNGKRMFCKIDQIRNIPLEYGDRVFVLDTDLIIQDDIFAAFDTGLDVGITSRHYQYYFPINGGVWCFKWNPKTEMFMDFYVEQIKNSTWKPFVDFQNSFQHRGNLDWWCDQDFLCVLPGNKLPFECNVVDIGFKYNFCPNVEDLNNVSQFNAARDEILSQKGNPEYKILHFKGKLKEVLR